jgi:hypothetical protein
MIDGQLHLDERVTYQRMLVPVGGRLTSNRGPEEAIHIAKPTNGRLNVVRMVDASPWRSARVPTPALAWTHFALAAHESSKQPRPGPPFRRRASRSTRCCTTTSPARSKKWLRPKPRSGRRTCSSSATHGRRGLEHWMMGGDAERICAGHGCPYCWYAQRRPNRRPKRPRRRCTRASRQR